MSIEERLGRLEKQNRNLRGGLVGLLLLVLVVAVLDRLFKTPGATTGRFDTVETQNLHMLSPNGQHLIAASVSDSGARWMLMDNERLDQVIVQTDDEGPMILVQGQSGSVSMSVTPADESALVSVDNARSKARLWLWATQNGCCLRLGRDKEDRAVLAAMRTGEDKGTRTTPRGSSLTLYDAKGKVIDQVPK